MITSATVEDERFEVDVQPELLRTAYELLENGSLDRETLRGILSQVQYVTQYSEELRSDYEGRVVVVAREEVAHHAGTWRQAIAFAGEELRDSPYYIVSFGERQEGTTAESLRSGSYHPAGVA